MEIIEKYLFILRMYTRDDARVAIAIETHTSYIVNYDEHVMSIHSIHTDEHEHTRTNESYKHV